MLEPNRLYYGDCLTVMQDLPGQSVDLIYLDPPFNSNRQYAAIYADETGRPLPDQVEAFCDMWELDPERERAIRAMPVLMRESGLDDQAANLWRLWMHSLRNTQPRLLAYLSYMTQRLLVMHRLMKPTASLYLHCDQTASHYIKALLDAVFGHQNFRAEIVGRRTKAKGLAYRGLPHNHDTLLYYTRGPKFVWNREFREHDGSYIEKAYRHIEPESGRRYRLDNLANPNPDRPNLTYEFLGVTRVWRWTRERMQAAYDSGLVIQTKPGNVPVLKRYLDESKGVAIDSIWDDVEPISSNSKERMGYATQKPVSLLERIIKTSTNPGDLVLDPFCGCATTMEAAHRLDRRWIGIDIAIHAVKRVAQLRLNGRLGLIEGKDYVIEGVPQNVEGAQDLWRRDKYQFQKWAVEQVDGFVTTKQSSDGGIDGRIYYEPRYDEPLQSMVLEVKGGASVSIKDLRALEGVLNADDAQMAGLIVMKPLGVRQQRNFDQFTAKAGFLNVSGRDYPRLQVLNIAEILEGKRFDTPVVFGHRDAEPLMPGLPAATAR